MPDTPDQGSTAIPPKLDLRKTGLFKPPTAPQAAAPDAQTRPSSTSATALPTAGAAANGPVNLKPAAPRPVSVATAGPAKPAPAAGAPVRPLFGAKPAGVAAAPVAPPRPPQEASAIAPTPLPVAPVGPAAAKKQTSRIPLEAARPAPAAEPATEGGAGGPKTIRIKAGGGGVAAPTSPPAPGPEVAAASKRTTSRISIEAVLGAVESQGEGAGPKTIRLKKPGELTAPKVVSPAGVKPAAPVAAEAAEAGAPPTVKRTVVVKRPTVAAQPAEAAAAQVARAAEPAMPLADAGDEPNVVFPLLALVACLVLAVAVYVFLVQCVGADHSLTEMSMGAPDMNLPWPGRIVAR